MKAEAEAARVAKRASFIFCYGKVVRKIATRAKKSWQRIMAGLKEIVSKKLP